MSNVITLKASDLQTVVKSLAEHFRTKSRIDHQEFRIFIPPSFGVGTITGVDFNDGCSMFLFDCHLKNPLILNYTEKCQPLRMIFCMEDDLMHSVKPDGAQRMLSRLMCSIIASTAKSRQQFSIPAHQQIRFYMIEIDRKVYLKKIGASVASLPAELKAVLKDATCSRHFFYQGQYNLAIAEIIQNISHNPYSGLVRRIYNESQALEVLALQLRQYIEDSNPAINQKVLRPKDVILIVAAKGSLLTNLVNPPTIKELAQLAGTNENKLKKGFRLLYNTTINKMLQDERLNRARLLIAEDKYPIREIAKMVGYKHSGHFTAKFKSKFGMLPKDYMKRMRL